MMAYTTGADRHQSSHECGCGCGGACSCENRCCDLECLVRPNYFCGQTLTDRDLTALVDWTRNRFGLARYRHGWGVVCGLDLSCTGPDDDPCCHGERPGQSVYVNPGYAIDCCGNDLVVCKSMPVDLSRVCEDLADPCEDPPLTPPAATDDNQVDAGRDQGQLGRLQEWGRLDPCLPWVSRRDLIAADLTLRYHEDLAAPQRTMVRSSCSNTYPCGHARIMEHPCVHVVPVKSLARTAVDDEADRWEKEFKAEARERSEMLRVTLSRGDLADAIRYVRQHPPSTLCFIEEYLCCLQAASGSYKTWGLRVRMWLLLDWVLQRLRCECWNCRPDSGVRIGRVLLRRTKNTNGEIRCRVVMVDNGPRHRRELSRTCRPARKGAIDLTQYLWREADDLMGRMPIPGVVVRQTTSRLEETEDAFNRLVFWVPEGSTVQAIVTEDVLGTPRVAAFVLA
jgi:hypothetical protein